MFLVDDTRNMTYEINDNWTSLKLKPFTMRKTLPIKRQARN